MTYGQQQASAPQGQPWGYQPQQPPPSNGLAIAALVLGIITIGLSPLPIMNQAGILVGLVGVALAIPALIIGVRRHVRVAMAVTGLVLSVVGLLFSFAFTDYYVSKLDQAFAPVTSQPNISESGGVGNSASDPAPGPKKYTFQLSGTARQATVNYSLDGSSGGGIEVNVPWSTEMTTTQNYNSAMLTAYSEMGSSGNLTCKILDETGAVVAQQTAESQGGDYGSASVNCFG